MLAINKMTEQELLLAKKRGRPVTGRGQTIGVRLQPEMISALDAWIEARPHPKPSRPEAIRTFVAAALARNNAGGT
jgi:hypothetical protein